jgi:hypothetical protein
MTTELISNHPSSDHREKEEKTEKKQKEEQRKNKRWGEARESCELT